MIILPSGIEQCLRLLDFGEEESTKGRYRFRTSTRATSKFVGRDQVFPVTDPCGETFGKHGNSAVAGRPIIIGASIYPTGGNTAKTPVAINKTILRIVYGRGIQGSNVMELR